MSADESKARTEPGVVKALRNSPLDIVVTRGDGRDVLVKAGEQVLLLDKSEARTLAKEIKEELMESIDDPDCVLCDESSDTSEEHHQHMEAQQDC